MHCVFLVQLHAHHIHMNFKLIIYVVDCNVILLSLPCSFSPPSSAGCEGVPRSIWGGAGEQQHHRHGGRHRGSRRPLHPHPPLCHVQVSQSRWRLLSRGREPQLYQQLGHAAQRQHQGQTAGHRQNLQKQEEQRQGVLRLRSNMSNAQTYTHTPLYIMVYVHK